MVYVVIYHVGREKTMYWLVRTAYKFERSRVGMYDKSAGYVGRFVGWWHMFIEPQVSHRCLWVRHDRWTPTHYGCRIRVCEKNGSVSGKGFCAKYCLT